MGKERTETEPEIIFFVAGVVAVTRTSTSTSSQFSATRVVKTITM